MRQFVSRGSLAPFEHRAVIVSHTTGTSAKHTPAGDRWLVALGLLRRVLLYYADLHGESRASVSSRGNVLIVAYGSPAIDRKGRAICAVMPANELPRYESALGFGSLTAEFDNHLWILPRTSKDASTD